MKVKSDVADAIKASEFRRGGRSHFLDRPDLHNALVEVLHGFAELGEPVNYSRISVAVQAVCEKRGIRGAPINDTTYMRYIRSRPDLCEIVGIQI